MTSLYLSAFMFWSLIHGRLGATLPRGSAALTPRRTLLLRIFRGAFASLGVPREYFLTIRHRYVSRVDRVGSILRQEAFDRYRVTDLQRILSPALPVQAVWRAAFNGKIDVFAAGIFRVNIEVDVGIHPLHFRDLAAELDRLVVIVFRSKRVVCNQGHCAQQQTGAETANR